MSKERQAFLAQVNLARYHGQTQGFYESFFHRANHPTRPVVVCIHHTLFSRPDSQHTHPKFVGDAGTSVPSD